jgi:hypothetical protein
VREVRAWWWADAEDGAPGRHPYTSIGPSVLGGEVVRMEIIPRNLPVAFRGWSLIAKAYTRTADVVLVLDDGQDGG